MLAFHALATFPEAFGQVTRLVTGEDATDPAFQQRWTDFLAALAARLTGEVPDASAVEAARVLGRAGAAPMAARS